MSTVFVGQFYTITTGFTQAALNYLMALRSVDHPFQIMPFKWGVQWSEYPEWSHPVSQEAPMGLARNVGLLHDFPERFPNYPHPGDKANLGLTTFESDYLPKRILDQLQFSVDAVVVPSTFNKKVLEESGISIPVHVAHHTIGPHWWESAVDLSSKPDTYVYGYVGHYNDRKNPEAAIRAYLRAFPVDKGEAAFLLKSVTASGDDSTIEERVARIVQEETGLSAERDDIWIYDSIMDEKDIRWVYSMIDCYVSPHRAEGFGLGPFQAKLLGKPVIYTNYSGVTDFLCPSDGDFPVSYSLVDAPKTDKINGKIWNCPSMHRPIQWADPSIDELVSAFKASHGKGPLHADRLDAFRDEFGWRGVGHQLGELLLSYA